MLSRSNLTEFFLPELGDRPVRPVAVFGGGVGGGVVVDVVVGGGGGGGVVDATFLDRSRPL